VNVSDSAIVSTDKSDKNSEQSDTKTVDGMQMVKLQIEREFLGMH
jgi:hypothetical protein